MFMGLIFTNYSLSWGLRKNTLTTEVRVKNIFEKCKKKLNIKRDIEIITQQIIGTPALFGVIKPRILLTPAVSGLSDKELEYVLLHELAHYKRKDLTINYLLLFLQVLFLQVLFLQAVHWFNPVICMVLLQAVAPGYGGGNR